MLGIRQGFLCFSPCSISKLPCEVSLKPPDFLFYGDFMNARIKLSARAALAGSQLKIVPLVTAIMFLLFTFSLCNAAVNMIQTAEKGVLIVFSAFSLLAFIVAVSPLRLRLEIKHLLLARGMNPSRKISLGLSGVFKSCGMLICLFVLKAFWLLFFELIPLSSIVAFAAYAAGNAVSLKAAYMIWGGITFIALAGLAFYALFIQRYSKAWFYLACFKDMKIFEAIEESVKKTQNMLSEIMLFKLGFIPWFLLCIGIAPALFVIPYYKQSITCYFLNNR